MDSGKKMWIVSLQSIACATVVLLHVASTWVEGS